MRSHFSHFKQRHFKQLIIPAALVLIAGSLFTSLSCGKRMPPLPPNERVSQRAELTSFQRGDEIILQWQMPARNAPSGSTMFIDRVDIYRLVETAGSPTNLSEEEFAARSVLITTQQMTADDFELKTISYRDKLQFAGQSVRLRYAIRFVNQQGQKAAFSNFVIYEPAANVARPPTSLSFDLSQDSVSLNWLEPKNNVDNTTPPNIIGYNVYRSETAVAPGRLLNESPVTDTRFTDDLFEFDKSYFYFVRAVSLGPNASRVESGESNVISVKTIDTFPPSPPGAITLAATPTRISIFFPANPETDVVGYRIYRSEDQNLPLTQWNLLTDELYELTTYQDDRVESGKTYFYYLTAVDRFGNVSDPSQIVSEKVP